MANSVGFATVLLHPVCMMTLDGLATFRRLVAACREYSTGFVGETVARRRATPARRRAMTETGAQLRILSSAGRSAPAVPAFMAGARRLSCARGARS